METRYARPPTRPTKRHVSRIRFKSDTKNVRKRQCESYSRLGLPQKCVTRGVVRKSTMHSKFVMSTPN